MNRPVTISEYSYDIVSRYAELNGQSRKSAIEDMIDLTMRTWLVEQDDEQVDTEADKLINHANSLLPDHWQLNLCAFHRSAADDPSKPSTMIGLNVGLDFIPLYLTPDQVQRLQRELSDIAVTGGETVIKGDMGGDISVRRRGSGLVFELVKLFGKHRAPKVTLPRSHVERITTALGLAIDAQVIHEKELTS